MYLINIPTEVNFKAVQLKKHLQDIVRRPSNLQTLEVRQLGGSLSFMHCLFCLIVTQFIKQSLEERVQNDSGC